MSEKSNQAAAGAREASARIISGAGRVVVKVGSAVLTDESGLDLRVVNRLADQMAALHDKGMDLVLVSSGAVAAGRGVLGGDPSAMPERQAASSVGQSRLMHAYDQAFGQFGKVTAQVLLTRDDVRSRARFLNALNTLRTLLEWRVVPVINENDAVAVQEIVGDNDMLASLVVSLVEADLFVNLTSAGGVYDKNPGEHGDAALMPVVEGIEKLDLDALCSGKSRAGIGGMKSKLLAARRAAQLGVPTLILSGREPYALEKAFAGEPLGTWIPAAEKRISSRKFWLAYNDQPTGRLVVDSGAARALTERGKSLLPAGIVQVDGDFERGALVTIAGPEGRQIGVGLSNYEASELRKIMGRKSCDVADVLGACPYQDAVHRDNMLLDAAV
jgi:glutamate 5-kinase